LEDQRVQDLREVLNHPGWQVFVDLCERELVALFQQLFFLDAMDSQSYNKFIELRSRIDQLRDMTYFIERELSNDTESIDLKYGSMFRRILKKLLA